MPIIVDGKWSQADIDYHNVDTTPIKNILKKHNLDCENIILATIDEKGKLLIHPQDKLFFIEHIDSEEN